MKTIKILTLVAISFAVLFTSCKKNDENISEIGDDEATIFLRTVNYESNIAVPLEKTDGSEFYTKGKIEYKIDGVVEASFDYGDGEKDQWGKKTYDGKTEDCELEKKKDGECTYDKKIIVPLVKADDCDYIVEGIIKYYQKDKWVATVDYGDGTCDEWATKTTNEGTFTFSQADVKKDYGKGK